MTTTTSEKIVELSNKQLVSMAPSIGAEKSWGGASDKYSFISTLAMVDHLRGNGWVPVYAGQSGVRDTSREGYQKHVVKFSKKELLFDGSRADILLYNSHDLSSSHKLFGGMFRFVCGNGMVVGNTLAEFIHYHKGFSIDDFIESSNKLSDFLTEAPQIEKKWQSIELTPDEQGIFSRAACQAIFENKQTFEPEKLLVARRPEDQKLDLWHTFNVIQENLIKGGLEGTSSNGRSTKTRGVTSLTKDQMINQTLWRLSDRMADIKAA